MRGLLILCPRGVRVTTDSVPTWGEGTTDSVPTWGEVTTDSVPTWGEVTTDSVPSVSTYTIPSPRDTHRTTFTNTRSI